jgi:hypothetical protein
MRIPNRILSTRALSFCLLFSLFFAACSKNESGVSLPSQSESTPSPTPTDPAFSPEFLAWMATFPSEITDKDARRLRREALTRLEKERSELRVEEQRELKRGVAERKRKRADWLREEKNARRKFFAENLHGPERRSYVQDFNARRVAFFAELKAEERAQKAAFSERKKELQERQARKMQAVESALQGRGLQAE